MRHKAAIIPLVMAALLTISLSLASAEYKEYEKKSLNTTEFLFLLGDDPTTGTKFWGYAVNNGRGICKSYYDIIYVYGIAPKNISLLDNVLAKGLAMKGGSLWLDRCGEFWGVMIVRLVYEDATLINGVFGPVQVTSRLWGSNGELSLTAYENHAEIVEQAKAAEKKRLDAQKRINEFLRQNKVVSKVEFADLSANPFVHRGKTLAYYLNFQAMLTETQGIFTFGGQPVLVSNLPQGLFIRPNENFIIVGRVLGKSVLKGIGPLVDGTAAMHFQFIASYSCAKNLCPDL